MDPQTSVAEDSLREDETAAASPALPEAVARPEESFPPNRNWKAGGDLMGTSRVDKAPLGDPSTEDEGPAEPCVMLDEARDLLVINEPACLRKLLASGKEPAGQEPKNRSGTDDAWTGGVTDSESGDLELDNEVLARAAEWVDW